MTPRDLDIVAKTVWGEARGEGRKGMQAVAEVILNRAKMELLSLDDDGLRLAYRAVLDALEDANITFGANHYFAPGSIAMPKWARDMELVAEIGRHRFYRG